MSTQIYGRFQARVDGVWVPLGESVIEDGLLKYWLTDFNPQCGIEPIAPFRGLPEGCQTHWGVPDDLCSWLLADEILDALPLIERGTSTLTEEEFHRMRDPAYWVHDPVTMWWVTGPSSRFISATCKRVLPGPEFDLLEVEFVFDSSNKVADFVAFVQRLKAQHGEVRFVFEYA